MSATQSVNVHAPMRWSPSTHFSRKYQLRQDETILAEIQFQGLCGSMAHVSWNGEHFTFQRQGWLSPRVLVRKTGSPSDEAVFNPSWHGGGELTVKDGTRLKWRAVNFFTNKWGFYDERREPVLSICARGILARAADVRFHTGAASSNVPLLATLAWYLMRMQENDAAVTFMATN
jgi:hypothetical protein